MSASAFLASRSRKCVMIDVNGKSGARGVYADENLDERRFVANRRLS